jgi:hypothetical protein
LQKRGSHVGWDQLGQPPMEKADVVEYPEAFDHIGLLSNEPPSMAGLPFVSSSDFKSIRIEALSMSTLFPLFLLGITVTAGIRNNGDSFWKSSSRYWLLPKIAHRPIAVDAVIPPCRCRCEHADGRCRHVMKRERCSRRSSKSGKQAGVRSWQAVEQTLPAVNRLGEAVRWTDSIVDHVGYQDVSVRRGKLERNLALSELDHADMLGDAFTLFNLGWTLMDLGRTQEALGGKRRLSAFSPGRGLDNRPRT